MMSPAPFETTSRAIRLISIGTAVPTASISQLDAAELAKQFTHGRYRNTVPALYRRAGVEKRHSVVCEESTPDPSRNSFYPAAINEHDRGPSTAARMKKYADEAASLAERACRVSFGDSKIVPKEITHLVTVSCTGFSAPGMDLALVERLGLSRQVRRTHVGYMGCHGLLNAFDVGRAFAAEPGATVLVCAVELCTLHQQYTDDPQQIVANALFADGAAAVLMRQESQDQQATGWALQAQSSYVIPDTADMMTWKIDDHGFQMTLSPKVPDVIRTTLADWLQNWLNSFGLTVEDIPNWAIHPGGPKVITATGQALNLSPEQLVPSQSILKRYGNMSSPTIAFILNELQINGASGPCVTLAFGPGLTIEVALLTR